MKIYRKRCAAEAKASLMMKRRTPRRISQAHVESIFEFLKTKRLWRVTVKDIMTYIESSTNLRKLSSFSFRKILSQSLNYSYKKADKLCSITLKQNKIHKFCESASIQIRLEWKGIELIYIIEFSFNSRQNKLYNWSERGRKKHLLRQTSGVLRWVLCWDSRRNTFTGLWGLLEPTTPWCLSILSTI